MGIKRIKKIPENKSFAGIYYLAHRKHKNLAVSTQYHQALDRLYHNRPVEVHKLGK